METLLLTRWDVASLLGIDECMSAVEKAFRLHGQGQAAPPKVMGVQCIHGGFHVKAGILGEERSYFVAKVNANFPGNPKSNGLPTIQGIIVVCDANDGRLLALMDSIEITIIRTGAATGVAANYLARRDAAVATICGCGNQGRISLLALMQVRKIKKVFVSDLDRGQVQRFKQVFDDKLEIVPIELNELPAAFRESAIIVTCTPSKQPFIAATDIVSGSFIAAVGADNEDKCELCPDLLASNKTVTDITDQCVSIGELHHAIENKLMTRADVHAELGEIIAHRKPGRVSDDEIIIFDSTGTALQDVAAASIVYEKAISREAGKSLDFSKLFPDDHSGSTEKNQRAISALRSWFPFK